MSETPSKQNRFIAGNTMSKGRPRKAPSLDEMIAAARPAVAEKVIGAALSGDMAAAAIVLGMSGRGMIR
jgi:hypothetical protein